MKEWADKPFTVSRVANNLLLFWGFLETYVVDCGAMDISTGL